LVTWLLGKFENGEHRQQGTKAHIGRAKVISRTVKRDLGGDVNPTGAIRMRAGNVKIRRVATKMTCLESGVGETGLRRILDAVRWTFTIDWGV
jgi:hypothetical protein